MAEVIDVSRIPQKSIIEFLRKHNLQTIDDLSNLRSLCYVKNDPTFHYHSRSFSIAATREQVWKAYKTISPEKTWSGNMISFGMMFSRAPQKITYAGEEYSGIEAGQVLLLNLNLIGIANLAVAHEIKKVVDEEFRLEICYLQHGASIGTQFISVVEDGPVTKVLHETLYRSNSLFRDKVLYPYFHTKAITEFHANVKRFAEALL